MNERLSPKKAPPTTAPTNIGNTPPVLSDISIATGTMAAIVPTDVPTQRLTRHALRNRPTRMNSAGMNRRHKSTIASTAPASRAPCAKAPARMKIQTISNKSCAPAPEEKMRIRWSKLNPLSVAIAKIATKEKTTVIGSGLSKLPPKTETAIKRSNKSSGSSASQPLRVFVCFSFIMI